MIELNDEQKLYKVTKILREISIKQAPTDKHNRVDVLEAIVNKQVERAKRALNIIING